MKKTRSPISDSILITDYGRSGQGWLSYMLCYILNARFVEPYALLRGIRHTKSGYVLSRTLGKLPGRAATKYSFVVKTHELPDAEFELTDKVIHLLRDPRDVTVSAYYRARNQRAQRLQRSLKGRIVSFIMRFRFSSLLFTYRRWKRHANAWKRIPRLAVRYEDLNTRTEEELFRILRYLEVKASKKIVKEAVSAFSFEQITGRAKGVEDRRNQEFRKGIVGDYKNFFSPLELRLFEILYGRELNELLEKYSHNNGKHQ